MRSGGDGPSWSLSVEAFFYLCFPLLVRPVLGATVRRGVRIGLGAVVLMVAWTVLYSVGSKLGLPSITVLSTYRNPLDRLGEFTIGICLAVAMRNGWRVRISMVHATVWAALAYAGLALANWGVIQSGLSLGDTKGLPLGVLDLLYLPVTAFLIAAAATSDLAQRPCPFKSRWMVRLGKWSFALYLVQMIVISQVAQLARPDVGWRGAFLLVGTMLACILLSAILRAFVEKPMEAA